MSGWTDRLAGELSVPAIEPDVEARLLDASREVAHRIERKDTPLSAFLIGMAVGLSTSRGAPLAEAIDEAFETLARTLPDTPETR